jgi:hypothetical protein
MVPVCVCVCCGGEGPRLQSLITQSKKIPFPLSYADTSLGNVKPLAGMCWLLTHARGLVGLSGGDIVTELDHINGEAKRLRETTVNVAEGRRWRHQGSPQGKGFATANPLGFNAAILQALGVFVEPGRK